MGQQNVVQKTGKAGEIPRVNMKVSGSIANIGPHLVSAQCSASSWHRHVSFHTRSILLWLRVVDFHTGTDLAFTQKLSASKCDKIQTPTNKTQVHPAAACQNDFSVPTA